MKRLFLGLCLLLSGCGVNRAAYDPYSMAPDAPCVFWQPDCKASQLACEELECIDLPDSDAVLSLAEVIDIAMINNTDSRQSWAKARLAAAEYGLSQSTFFPHLSADFSYEHSRTAYLASQVDQPGAIDKQILITSNQSQWGPQAHLTWTLLDFGQRRYTSETARYALYFADYTHNQTIQSVIEEVTIDYYAFLAEKKQLEAKEADLVNAEETLEAAELSLKKGVKNVSDVLQARSQALLAEIELSEQRKILKTAYTTLLSDMGLPANAQISLQKLPFVDPASAELEPLDQYLEMAFECRPDLLAARAKVTSAEKRLKGAKLAWTPTLDYSLDIGRTYFEGGFHDNYDFTSTLSVSIPLFTGFHIRNTINSAGAKLELAEALLRENELEVIKEVTNSHYNVGVAFDTLRAAVLFLKSAKEQYKVALLQYKAGVNTILDLISAQTALFDARAKQSEATREWFTTLARLTYSAGILTYDMERL